LDLILYSKETDIAITGIFETKPKILKTGAKKFNF